MHQWDIIVATARHSETLDVYIRSFRELQAQRLLSRDCTLLAAPDPMGDRVGSGGATLNALVVVAEYLSQRHGDTFVNVSRLRETGLRILIVHFGCATALFPPLAPGVHGPDETYVRSNVGSVLSSLACIVASPHDGVWICSAEEVIGLSQPEQGAIDIGMLPSGITAVSIPTPLSVATSRGVYVIPKNTRIEQKAAMVPVADIIYRCGDKNRLRDAAIVHDDCGENDPLVPVVCGMVFMDGVTAEVFAGLHAVPAFEATTYLGADNGACPLNFSLFLDVMLCCASEMSSGSASETFGTTQLETIARRQSSLPPMARHTLWQRMHHINLHAVVTRPGLLSHFLLDSPIVLGQLLKQQALSYSADHRPFRMSVSGTITVAEKPLDSGWNCAANDGSDDNGAETPLIVCSVLDGHGSLAPDAIVVNCELIGSWNLQSNSMAIGLDSTITNVALGSNLIAQQVALRRQYPHVIDTDHNYQVLVVIGANDDIDIDFESPRATYAGMPWSDFFEATGILPEDLWPESLTTVKSLRHARLFPICDAQPAPDAPKATDANTLTWFLSATTRSDSTLAQWRSQRRGCLSDAIAWCDVGAQLSRTTKIGRNIDLHRLELALCQRSNVCTRPVLSRLAADATADRDMVFQMLDKVASEQAQDVSARSFVAIAEFLAALAGDDGGLRSGPGRNECWREPFLLLKRGLVAQAVPAMARLRQDWFISPQLILRAARHYEGAAQILIQRMVETANSHIVVQTTTPMPVDHFVQCEAAARLDFAGGWSDTPPISCEHGGHVINCAVKVDGQRPIGCRATRIDEPILRFIGEAYQPKGAAHEPDNIVECRAVRDLSDFSSPSAPAALLKAAIVCLGIVPMIHLDSANENIDGDNDDDDGVTLSSILTAYGDGGGLEVRTWSRLPQGSGLGTSSILAGVVIKAIGEVMGLVYDDVSLVHAVLKLEQMLTTGGGWQDQVGGLLGGVKTTTSAASLPLQIVPTVMNLPTSFISELSSHLVLIYTGRTRLARNLLQNVIRRWYSRLPEIVETVDALVSNAKRCQDALSSGDVEVVGDCVSTFWRHKMTMAPGCEPDVVRSMRHAIQPVVHGVSLAGAGGGGFMFVVAKAQGDAAVGSVRNALANAGVPMQGMSFHNVEIDESGVQTKRGVNA